jgi:DNA-binding transcriptional LysR family regulator
LLLGRGEAREAAQAETSTLRFASTHALSLTFFPVWLRSIETRTSIGAINLVADNMQGCEQLMLQGQASFLLCHHHPSATTKLDPQAFQSVTLGQDVLVPISTPDPQKQPLYPLPGSQDRPVPFLAYSASSGLGRILAGSRAIDGQPAWLDTVFTSHVAIVLKTMARNGRGIAWSPFSLVEDDLALGHLVRAGDKSWDIPVEIRLFRPRARQNQAAEGFWSLLTAPVAD